MTESVYYIRRKCENCGNHTSSAEFAFNEETQLLGILYVCLSCGYESWADWHHPTPQDIIDEQRET